MNVYQFNKMVDTYNILERILEIKKTHYNTYTGPVKAKPGEKFDPFFLDFTAKLVVDGKELEVSSALVNKFFYEVEDYYRQRLDAMGVEGVYRKPQASE